MLLLTAFLLKLLSTTVALRVSPMASRAPLHVASTARHPVAVASVTRREFALSAAALATLCCHQPQAVYAGQDMKNVVVAGATGQTGRRCLQRLAAMSGVTAIGGVRDPSKAAKKLAESKIEIRGAMIEKGAAIDASSVELRGLDVEKSSVTDMAATLQGADGLLIAVGFVPGNPFKMDAAAHAVDNIGTVALIDAAKDAGVRKVVLVSSILTDAGDGDYDDTAQNSSSTQNSSFSAFAV